MRGGEPAALSPEGRPPRRRGAARAGRLRVLSVALALFASARPAFGQELFFQSLTTRDGLPVAQVFAVYQGSHGFVWLGTAGGLVRWDGVGLRTFGVRDGLPAISVRSLVEHDGALWIATDGGVSRYDGRAFASYTEAEGVGGGIVWRLVQHEGALWATTSDGGLCRLDGESWRCLTTEDGLPSDHLIGLLSDPPHLWVGTRDAGLARWDGRAFRVYGEEEGLTGRAVLAIVRAEDGLWVGSPDGGIFRLEGERFESVLPDVPVYSVARDGDHLLWGTLGQGVYEQTPEGLERLDRESGLAGDRVYSILVDREGSAWFGTDRGLSRLSFRMLTRYHPDSNVLSIAPWDGAVWLGTLGEGLMRMADGETRRYRTADGLPDDAIWALAGAEGRLWIGTPEGLSSFDGERFETLGPERGLAPRTVTAIVPDGPAVWAAGLGGVSRVEGEEVRSWTAADGLLGANVRAAALAGGRVCFALEGGVSCFDGEGFDHVTPREGLSSGGVFAVADDGEGGLWVGTDRGLDHVTPSGVESMTADDGLPDDVVTAIVRYRGKLWIGTTKGLAVVSGGRVERTYGLDRGLSGNEVNSGGLVVDGGELWIATSTGASLYTHGFEGQNEVPPLLHLERFRVGDIDVPLDGGARPPRLAHDHGPLSFSWVGLSFRDPASVRYRYRLEGYDDDWSAPTAERSVRYTSLPPGDYLFRVTAENEDGVAAEDPVTVPFVVESPPWRSWWFALLAGLAGFGLLTALVRLAVAVRLRKVRRQAEELDRLVRERTRQLDDANRELKELSLTDPLTGLANRRFFAETIGGELARIERALGDVARERRPASEPANLGFLLVDIDHFKRVNDAHGHAAGDLMLREIGELLRARLRASDLVIRWGGEEFLGVCKDIRRDAMHLLATRLAGAVRDKRFDLGGGVRARVTVSIGYSFFPFTEEGGDALTHEDVIALADDGLYVAKASGRDLVVGVVAGERPIPKEDLPRVKAELGAALREGLVRLVSDRDDLVV